MRPERPRAERLGRVFWLGVALFSPALPLHAYFAGNWYSIGHSYSLGMFAGVASYVTFANALVLSARVPLFDRLFGHDRVMAFHGYLAAAAIVLAFAHVVFKAVFGLDLGMGHVQAGLAALALFAIVAAVTLLLMIESSLHRLRPLAALRARLIRRRAFDYTRLKRFHNLTALALALVTVHVLRAAATAENRLRLGVMGAWGTAALAAYAYHKAGRAIRRYRQGFTVADVRPRGPALVEIAIRRPGDAGLPHRPGQFAYFRFLSPVCGRAEHPFTIASAPGESSVRIVVKALGDYTAALAALPTGVRALCDGPYGRFTPARGTGPFLFVAGGIGITPFLSILSAWDTAGFADSVTLVWTARTRAELFADGFFADLAKRHATFCYVPVVTREAGSGTGRIDRALLGRLVGRDGPARLSAYICGPENLRQSAVAHLRALGLPRAAVHFESFNA